MRSRRAWLTVAYLALFLFGTVMSYAIEYTAEQYIDDVVSGKQVACKWVRLAVERHLGDLDRSDDEGFPYYFDCAQARRAIDFIQQLRHTKGEWADPRKHDTRIRLEPWEQCITWILFGWRNESGYRRFTRAYIAVARKNGKSTLAAATANYCFVADRPHEMGPEVYAIATKRDQAKITWLEARRQIEHHPVLRGYVKLYRDSIVSPDGAGFFKPLGKDSKTEDGANAHFLLVDEYHAHPTDEMVAVMVDSTMSRNQPLTYIITTAGFELQSPCKIEQERVEQMLERSVNRAEADVIDESTFAIIYALDEGDDWTDEKVWPKANPNIGVSVFWERLREQVARALASPHLQNDVLTKHFNVWTQAETRWILDEVWMANATVVDADTLGGRRAYLGLDLSASQDITAAVLVFPPEKEGERYAVLPRFFIPGDDIIGRERRDKVPYTDWVARGIVTATPGNVIDYDAIESQILRDAEMFEIAEIAYDPWKAQEIVNHLTEAGFTMVPIYQRYSGMAAPSDTFEKKVLAQSLAHSGNPVLRWMMACTEVKSDRQGNIMPMKPRREATGKRIDGIVALIMGLGRAVVAAEGGGSVYEDEELFVI